MYFQLFVTSGEPPRPIPLNRGDRIYTSFNGIVYKLGERYKDFDAIVVEICYVPKKWWQFWKPKTIQGYIIEVTA